ncbi:hypothetical protein VCR31J2_440001 [Vibrio coralliirubri]|uniref:Uncharacterized protein n=1 Tax=Vibrio coralliirubri TaxID=1516159 RepID=A0AA87C3T4_9VIBR|nr:hypothetical protein [Vibrio coralliirubri]EJP4177943.1 hypothetical protein [Vibrio vulnificus]CDT44943.1 hypothetical protein VCR1J2_590036 [Vibrio coralliirubri]CDT98593.1 hypothetical protein VCR31J2_440001 [Vibrio coralliirubri]
MSIEIPTEQGFTMTYHYEHADLEKLKSLIINGGQVVIGIDYLQSDSDYLRHFKNSKFAGPYYAMPLDGVLEIINEALSKPQI